MHDEVPLGTFEEQVLLAVLRTGDGPYVVDTLTPPVAGTVSTTAEGAQTQAIEALFGGPSPRSQTETSMLERAGRDRAALGARSIAGDPATRVVDKGQTTVTIISAPEGDTQIASAQ